MGCLRKLDIMILAGFYIWSHMYTYIYTHIHMYTLYICTYICMYVYDVIYMFGWDHHMYIYLYNVKYIINPPSRISHENYVTFFLAVRKLC